MSSYHSGFRFLNRDSSNEGWTIAAFDADNGETDSYLSQEQVYADSYRGTKRLIYGTRYNSVPTIKITVIKCNGADFTVSEGRSAYRWLTGNPKANWLDLYIGEDLQYSFLGTVQDVKPYKLDARTIGLTIYFESISPWAYSAIQTFNCAFGQSLSVDNSGVLKKGDGAALLNINNNSVLYNGTDGGVGLFQVTTDGTMYIDNSVLLRINNETDDLYTDIYLETVFTNNNCDYLSIKNLFLEEETVISGMSVNEIVTLSAGQFIVSDVPNKIFGNNFNFVWPRLIPGINEFIISGSGSGFVKFSYRYPVKIGDCMMDINNAIENTTCGGSCSVDKDELHEMLNEILV